MLVDGGDFTGLQSIRVRLRHDFDHDDHHGDKFRINYVKRYGEIHTWHIRTERLERVDLYTWCAVCGGFCRPKPFGYCEYPCSSWRSGNESEIIRIKDKEDYGGKLYLHSDSGNQADTVKSGGTQARSEVGTGEGVIVGEFLEAKSLKDAEFHLSSRWSYADMELSSDYGDTDSRRSVHGWTNDEDEYQFQKEH
ncbi:hypothetical protein BCR34DRAFT_602589 [Clohesyomyces aquaticus]|uniref:Uncharacterized protein n=1 Tax=Clohesyomyces aquaticus TaxID=1231657 RepID=A0A1Y1ZIR7_9PLEO|nr:hypothetical protein BCR34DRAFT_602589 [Clohesyomyces aquaticus]